MQFLRCGVSVDDKEVVAVVLSDVAHHLKYSCSEIKCTLEGKYGRNGNKDFLRGDADVPVIRRGKTDKRRRCFCFFLDFISPKQVEELRKGETNL